MVRVEVEACDVCADPAKEVSHCLVAIEGEEATLSLCVEHAEPLRELLSLSHSQAPVTTPKQPAKRSEAPSRPARKASSAKPRKRAAKKAPAGKVKMMRSLDVPVVSEEEAQALGL